MAQVTVEQLAETVGASVDRLLAQMKDAGLPHSSADEAVSEEDKQTLLAHLKKSHGERAAGAPKKITLKRKSVSTLRAGGAGKRTVNVEVRKKRTYVKRPEIEEAPEVEAVEPETTIEAEAIVTPEPVEPVVAESTPEPEPVVEEPAVEVLPEVSEEVTSPVSRRHRGPLRGLGKALKVGAVVVIGMAVAGKAMSAAGRRRGASKSRRN